MSAFRLLYRDVDRMPYLLALQQAAAARGLELELERHRQVGNEDWGERLKRADIDGIAENYWALVRYRAAGVPFVTVASASHVWRETLLVRPDMKTLDELRGKRLAARAAGPQIWFPAVFLQRAGLTDDVEVVQVPETETGRWGHWKRVASGDCDACFMSRLYIDEALAAGLHELPYPEFAFEGGHICPTVTENTIERDPEAVQMLVSAMFDAGEAAGSPANLMPFTERALAELRAFSPLDTPAQVERFNERLAAEVAPQPIPALEGIRNALDLVRLRFPNLAGFDPLMMWDLSFARKAQRERGLSDASAAAHVAGPMTYRP